MDKRTKKLVAVACLSVLCLTGFTYSAIISSTDTTRDVSTAGVGISLVQTSADGEEIANDGVAGFTYEGVVPGEEIEESMAVQADSDSSQVFVRVTATRYWQKDGQKDNEALNPADIQFNTSTSDWVMIEDADDDEVVYFYYTKPLSAGEVSQQLVDSITLLPESSGNSNKYSGYNSHVDYFAESVQVMAGQDAILAEWGVEVTLDDQNNILTIKEQ